MRAWLTVHALLLCTSTAAAFAGVGVALDVTPLTITAIVWHTATAVALWHVVRGRIETAHANGSELGYAKGYAAARDAANRLRREARQRSKPRLTVVEGGA